MKNKEFAPTIEKLRLNVLTLVEAKYMADRINILSVKAESLDLALKSVSCQFRLRLASVEETAAKQTKEAAEHNLRYKTLWRRIKNWEVVTGRDHAKLLDGESE